MRILIISLLLSMSLLGKGGSVHVSGKIPKASGFSKVRTTSQKAKKPKKQKIPKNLIGSGAAIIH